MDLSDFLLARIAEDEVAATEAGGDSWEVADPRKVRWVRNGGNAHGWAAFADLPTATEHIARHDPARVLAECEAKRQVIHLAEYVEVECSTALDEVLRRLAVPYADHPDYDPEWKV